MEAFVKGDIVVVKFPFSNLKEIKRRPTVVSCSLEGEDIILCQITSKNRIDKYSITLEN